MDKKTLIAKVQEKLNKCSSYHSKKYYTEGDADWKEVGKSYSDYVKNIRKFLYDNDIENNEHSSLININAYFKWYLEKELSDEEFTKLARELGLSKKVKEFTNGDSFIGKPFEIEYASYLGKKEVEKNPHSKCFSSTGVTVFPEITKYISGTGKSGKEPLISFTLKTI